MDCMHAPGDGGSSVVFTGRASVVFLGWRGGLKVSNVKPENVCRGAAACPT